MTKKLHRSLALAAASMICLAHTAPAQAGGASRAEIEQLKQQVQQLLQQNQQLSQRISEMEKSVQAQEHVPAKSAIEEEVSRQLSEKKSGPAINEFVSLSGSIEGDYKLSQAKDGADTSEFVLDTVELILDVNVTDWATGKIVIDYDGDDDDRFYLDEANITLGNTEEIPFFLTAGKIYVPFGDFSTNMIQDPLTQTLGEINPKGVIIGYEANGLSAAVFSYNGMDEGDEDNTINGFGASLAYSYEQDDMGFNAGAAWVNNIADSATLSDMGFATVIDQVPGISAHAGGTYKAFSAIAEYTAALDNFDATEVPYDGNGGKPRALNTEVAYTTAIMEKETVFAIGYQKSWEAYALDLPEHRYITSASMNVFEGTTISLEYYIDKFYSEDPDAAEDDGYGFTTRLAYEF